MRVVLDANIAVQAWAIAPIDRAPTDAITEQIWALRHSVRVADAHYIALA